MRRASSLAALAVAAFALAACGGPPVDIDTGADSSQPRGHGDWERLPDSPLSARYGALLIDLTGDLLVLGGDTQRPCHDTISGTAPAEESQAASGLFSGQIELVSTSGTASCASPNYETKLSDGAVFDFDSGEWRRIKDAPVPVGYATSAVLDGKLVLWVGATFFQSRNLLLSYDPDADEWSEMSLPPALEDQYGVQLTTGDGKLLAYDAFADERGTRDWLFDPRTFEWSALPPDPLKPSHDRTLLWFDDRWVVLGPESMELPEETRSPVQRAAVLDGSGEWRRLPDSEILGGSWARAAGRAVAADMGASDGFGQYGRSYPYGGILDPKTEAWTALPTRDESRDDEGCRSRKSWMGGAQRVHAAGDPIVVRDDWALHVDELRWEAVPCDPDGTEFGFGAAWVGDRLVKWGGYDAVAEPGRFPTEYKFHNDGATWQPKA